MFHVFALVLWATVVVGVVLGVSRNIPILEVFGFRKTFAGNVAAHVIGLPCLAAIVASECGATVFGVDPGIVAFPVGIGYLWWCMAWRLRHDSITGEPIGAACNKRRERARQIVAIAFALFALSPSVARAWNNLGHRTVADIAWSQLDEATRKKIVDTLRRHPRFVEDFAKQMPKVDDEDRWIFDQAATWPDLIRNNKDYDHPSWHYVDFPYFVGPERPVKFNRATTPSGDPKHWNVMQALASCREAIKSGTPEEQAIAYCWIFHLVGDCHQPLHSTSLVSDKFSDPDRGDKGGNLVLVTNGKNLHSVWDGFLGRQDRPQDVAKAVAELKAHPEWWKVDTTIDVPAWVQESHKLCRAYVYTPEMLEAAKGPGEWQPMTLPESYLKASGEHARQRVVAAGLRLAAVLTAKSTGNPPASATPAPLIGTVPTQPATKPAAKPGAAATASYWLNMKTNIRHNSTCRYYMKSEGRACGPDEGTACKVCGG